MAKAQKQPDPAQIETAPGTGNDMAALPSFVVLTDREPCWDGVYQPKNAVITGPADDEAIVAMLERGWIEEVSHG